MGSPGVGMRPRSGLEVALGVWYRRKWLAAVVFLVPFAAIAGATRTLPDVYESTATVLVEHQQVPERLVGAVAAGELETRLRTISQQIMSRARLNELIARFDLYPQLRQQATPDVVVEAMRRDIDLEFKEVRQPSGQDATIAFSLSYRGRDPATVAQVTNALAALYVEENARAREQQTTGATEFLRAQLEDARQQLDQQERMINEFKGRNMSALPEQQAVNLAALERLNGQLRVINDQELKAVERRDDLAKQLAALPAAGGDGLPARLAKLRQELADLRTRYTDEHPDVARVQAEIADLERQLATARPDGAPRVESPDVHRVKDAIAQVDTELAALKNQEQVVRQTIAAYEARLENTPRLDTELQQLSRDYATAKERYQSLLQRYEDAQLAERLDQRLQGGQFSILDSAVPSQHPVAPHRIRLLLMGLMVSVGAAAGASLLAESRDTSFHAVDDVRAFTGVPILVSIPPIRTVPDIRRRRVRFSLAAFVAMLGAAGVATASAYLARSNDLLVRLLTPGRF